MNTPISGERAGDLTSSYWSNHLAGDLTSNKASGLVLVGPEQLPRVEKRHHLRSRAFQRRGGSAIPVDSVKNH